MKKQFKLAIYVILIFAAGFLSGYIWQSVQYKSRGWRPHRLSTAMKDMTTDLNLTQEQELEVDAIIEEARERTRLIHLDISPDMARIQHDSYESIEAILTPEQQTLFKKIRSKASSNNRQ